MQKLREFFTGTATKYLSEVDTPSGSNQHEVGSNSFLSILGDPRMETLRFEGLFLYFTDDEEPVQAKSSLSWYDTRRNNPNRSAEYRLYYTRNAVTERMVSGDFFLLAKRPDNSLLIVVAKAKSTIENQLRWLFGIEQVEEGRFHLQDVPAQQDLSFVHLTVLDALGIEAGLSDERWLNEILNKFGGSFPSTHEFGKFARKTSKIDAREEADAVLVGWMSHEEMLFRTLERHIVQQQLDTGFEDVNHFVQFSLAVQNRRKARVGRALENHLSALLETRGIFFTAQALTEFRTKADFIFPNAAAYANPKFPAQDLTMLAAKTTCKDRWRQVLSEANRISNKHLITLEPGISKHQTDEMRGHNLQLVLPRSIWPSYTLEQHKELMTLQDFISLVAAKQQTGN